jgi:hypothetical protein
VSTEYSGATDIKKNQMVTFLEGDMRHIALQGDDFTREQIYGLALIYNATFKIEK